MKHLFGIFLLLLSSFAMAKDPISTGFFSNKAVSGYDTVAYFTEGRPVKGSSKFTTRYQGAVWQFASEKHLAMFEAEPEKYAPQFGGYCAWAVSAKSDFAPSDPKQWAIVDGKLYLNYDAKIKALWDETPALHISQADQNWPQMIGKP
ncbi:YHS domain-containing (seleno)protein [Marinomonas dokdonensis]|uniref:YHS domain-containing (seleno)protein n=1 Tax=Marinomonas dokdonensis TaxID=328224 RepID=UPI0040556E0D